jgi:hypothetical protein
MMPIIIGRFAGGTVKETILVPPTERPAPPNPAIARPMINALELGATPQIKLPTSKRIMDPRKLHLRLKYLYIFPAEGWAAPKVMKYAAAYQDMSSRLWNSSVILGIAVPTMV